MPQFSTSERWTFVARAAVSLIILAVGLFIILSNSYPDAHVKWAFSTVGLVLGYWLR